MRFPDLDMTMYSRTKKSRKRQSEGETVLPVRVEAIVGVILYMARLATDMHTKMGAGSVRMGGESMGEKIPQHKGRGKIFLRDEQKAGRVRVRPG